ncbi:MAG TPA: DUF885 domain-containing protein [Candidatus Limnocylindrales bacterium]
MNQPADDLAQLAGEFWAATLAAHPIEATALGEPGHDDAVDDISPAGVERVRSRLLDLAARARAIPATTLVGEDPVTRTALIEEAAGEAAVLGEHLEEWTVDVMNGWPTAIQNVPSFQTAGTPERAAAMVERWRAFGGLIDQLTANLRRGLADGRVATHTPVVRAIDALTTTLATADEESALLEPLRVPVDDRSAAQRAAFADALTAAVRDTIRPALARHRAFLADEILPRARPDDRPGIGHVPGGDAAYRTLVRRHTTLELSPEALHATGLAEVERINAEMAALGERVLGAPSRADALERLRGDAAMHFSTRAEVEATARAALDRANAAVPAWFGRLPVTPCVVVPMPAHEEEHSSIAYYRPPAADGSRPGQYFLNTSHPESRPRYEAECLAFHEAVPGHHLQIAIAQELTGLPDFRRHLGATAFWEGWGLYTERLAEEMGLYTGDLDRIGMLSMDAWRACRLVVDTGMHALGWSRQAAIDYMVANSALAPNNIANEVDRYIVWPGQALAYKAGQLEMLRLRAEATARLGARFAVRAFHDALLGHGAVALTPLRGVIEAWLEAAAA